MRTQVKWPLCIKLRCELLLFEKLQESTTATRVQVNKKPSGAILERQLTLEPDIVYSPQKREVFNDG